MKKYSYQNNLIGKKQLRQLLAWSFTNYNCMQACTLADELKYLGFKYASQAGISISVEDLKVPFIKNLMLQKANQEIRTAEKIYLKGKITDVERFQKIIDTWSLTSESLKEQIIYYFKNYDPLNSVYIMAFSGARGNLSQVRQLIGMRGLMSDPSGEIMKLPIKKNFREGLTITDYLMSGYGARKGIVDTALKTANSGYLTRRLIDIGQDILIREKDCLTVHSFLVNIISINNSIYERLLGRILSKPIFDLKTAKKIVESNTQITPILIQTIKEKEIKYLYIRSPLTCNLYRAICQKCYGWDLANENLVDIGEAIGILAGQSIGEPGTQLTMRTFHTGGIFTSEARQQIISPVSGIIQFYKILNTVLLRTNRGEDVLITKNSGSAILIPKSKQQELVKIEILRNTILFPKNNHYILKDTVIGELINTNTQIKTEIKPILNDSSGEVFIPRLKKKSNLLNNNKLIWILSGQFYNSLNNSFVNFYSDYKLKRYSYVFRTKIINSYRGYIKFLNSNSTLHQRLIQISNKSYYLQNSNFHKLINTFEQKNYLLQLKTSKYLLKIQQKNYKFYIQLTRNQQLGTLITTTFRTLTCGTVYYNYRNIFKWNKKNKRISYLNKNNTNTKYKSFISHRTIIWLEEETYRVNCESNILFVEHGDFIAEGFELIPNLFSNTSGIVLIRQKNNLVQTISIKSGLVYEGKKFQNMSKKLYYPGEIILSSILVKKLSICEHVTRKEVEQLLVRPVEIYELSYSAINQISSRYKFNKNLKIRLVSKTRYSYKSNQTIKGINNLNLISTFLTLEYDKPITTNLSVELTVNKKMSSINVCVNEKFNLNNYLLPHLRSKNIQSCLVITNNQFIDSYSMIAYLEAITLNSLEIVKIKIKNKDTKQILLISNKDCFILQKREFPTKKLNSFIINNSNIGKTGKVIIENETFFTIQKGRPYFFPNCHNENLMDKTSLQYKILSPNQIYSRFKTKRSICLKYYNLTKLAIKIRNNIKKLEKSKFIVQTEFSKFFLKKNGKIYSSLIPQFSKKFSLTHFSTNLKCNQILKPNKVEQSIGRKINRILLLQSSENIKKRSKNIQNQLTLIQFLEYPFTKTSKAIGLYSITEDYFDQDINNIFCKNSEFIESDKTIGLLNLEKEITGDIVQGLPRIEEILEGRKKNFTGKRMTTGKKKGLLIQKTSLDIDFEFRRLGTAINENEKINPHNLLKVYFNYYGVFKFFVCDRKRQIMYTRLIKNYEGSYKSFKKVQLFILNAVQSVYQSQGVTINNKHLEVIIKQMTTKVLITYEGDTPLLRREVIDLYHIQHINKIIKIQGKQFACYVPLLLGISKAALNNPSFISAASFQETTRILTRAAIEGRIDWLRGLKENIIIGYLIPAGTGSQNYRNCFKKSLPINIDKF